MAEGEGANAQKYFISDNPNEKTFQYDSSLPCLPVPDLNDTLNKYLKSIEHLVTREEYIHTCSITNEFQNGIGKQLQEKLKTRADHKSNWLEEWWLQYAYLSVREPIAPCFSMTGVQSLHFTIWDHPSEEKALERTALSLWGTLQFYKILRIERLLPQKSRNGERLSMNQYRNLFNTARIPREGFDELYRCFKTESEGRCPDHIIVLCYGHIWYLNSFDKHGYPLTVTEIQEQLEYINSISEALGHAPGISALTADNREVWAKNRRWLASLSSQNAKHLSLVESAIAVHSLDENSPQDISEILMQSLCGAPQNRWADKSYGGITYKNGYLGNCCEHSPCDAMVPIVYGLFQHELLTKKLQTNWKEPRISRQLQMPRRLVFDVDDVILTAIRKAKELNASYTQQVEIKFHSFRNFGKSWLKENRFHPDAFIQCALQLSYYQRHKKYAPTYETAMTRKFYNARTETIRSCTAEVAEWIQFMISPSSSMMEKRSKMVNSINRHRELTLECENGQGIDRHLMGLYLTALESGTEIPELFTDPSFAKSGGGGNFILSTSTVGSTNAIGGVAAMVKDGYGIFYGIMPDRINFMLSNYKNENTCLRGISQSIDGALLTMQNIGQFSQSKM